MELDDDLDRLLENATWVRGLALHVLGDAGAAEDVAQETWIAAWSRGAASGGGLKPWLARAARNFALQRRREDAARGRRERAVARSESLPPAGEVVARAELHSRLVHAVLALEEPHRSMLLWRYFEELEPDEIARRARIEPATVRSRLKRARERLRAELERRGGSPDRWLTALVGWDGGRPAAALGGGAAAGTVVVMSIATKVGLAAGVAAVLAGVAWWAGAGSVTTDAARPGAERREAPPPSAISAESTDRLGTDPDSRTALAPEPPPAPTRPAESGGADFVRGIVLSDGDRAPIAGARIAHHRGTDNDPRAESTPSAAGSSVPSTTSAADGRFELAAPREPGLGLRIERDGYFPLETSDEELTHEPGAELELVLAPLGRIELTLVDESGGPATGARVFWRVELTRGSRTQRWAWRREFEAGETDAAGTLTIRDLPCGMSIFLARRNSIHDDASVDWLGSVVVDPLLRSAHHQARVATRSRIVGRLVTEAGEPLGERWLAWHRRPVDYWDPVPFVSGADGRFAIESVLPQPGELRVDLAGFEPLALTPEPGATLDVGDLALPTMVPVSGRLVSRFPVLGSEHRVVVYRGAREIADLTCKDAAFSCSVTPGPVSLEVFGSSGDGRGRLARVELAMPVEGLEIPIDSGRGGIELRFDEAPATSSDWTAYSRRDEKWLSVGSGSFDPAPSLVIGPLDPGTHRISIRTQDEKGPRALTGPIEVVAGAISDGGQVSFARTETAFRVADRSGKPIERAKVRIFCHGWGGEASSDAEGLARFSDLAPNVYGAIVDHEAHGRAWLEQLVLDGSRPIVDVELPGTCTIDGTLTAGSGPAGAVAVHLQPKQSNEHFSTTTDPEGRFRLEGVPAGRARLWVEKEFVEVLDLVAGEARRVDAVLGFRRRYGFTRDGEPIVDLRSAQAIPFDAASLAQRRWTNDYRTGDHVELALPPGKALFVVQTLRHRNGEYSLAIGDGSDGTIDLARGALELLTERPWSGSLPRATLVSLDGHEVVGMWGGAIELGVELDAEGRARVPCLPPKAKVRLRGTGSDGAAVDLVVETAQDGRARVEWP